jgi:hypothetical protein
VGGQVGSRLPGISSRSNVRMVVSCHSSNGLNHFRDRATTVGVMPLRERAFEL